MVEPIAERYKSVLSDFHGDCELNYLRLVKLLVQIDSRDTWQFATNKQSSLAVTVVDKAAHTTHLSFQGTIGRTAWLGRISLLVRVYHDARMAEVVLCQNKRVNLLRYAYPNVEMFQPNEKSQLNQFLGYWLDHFLREGSLLEPLSNI